MNARYLVVTFLLLMVVGASITSRSTLNPERGVDYVFYGGFSDFLAQEATFGDFNGDGKDDIVTTILLDDPTACDAPPQHFSQTFACDEGYGRWIFRKGSIDTTICAFPDPFFGDPQWQYWHDCGWEPIDTLSCGECWQAVWQSQDKGAAYVFKGGNWSGKPRDNDLTQTPPPADHMIVGGAGGDHVYNGMGAGDVDDDGYDELVLGASQPGIVLGDFPGEMVPPGTGEVYVIEGDKPGAHWPAPATANIVLPDDPLVSHVFCGRDVGDEFGQGIAVGDLDNDGYAEIVVAAPHGDKKNNAQSENGEVCIFYSNASLPTNVDLSTFATDQGMLDSTAAYLQVIWGADPNDRLGVTEIPDVHEYENRIGDYEPVGLAIGDWDGDTYNDLVIGAGHKTVTSGGRVEEAGAVYVIFGGPLNISSRKLKPGNTLDLAVSPGTSTGPDVRIVGKANSSEWGGALGAGVAFVDADGEGRVQGVKADLVIGAPRIHPEQYLTQVDWDSGQSAGETYIIFGDSRDNLTTSGGSDRNLNNSSAVNATILGQGFDDQLGGHIAGNFDIDFDGKNDIGISGQDIAFVIFGQPRSAWASTIALATLAQAHPETRFLSWTGKPPANSMTIKLLDLDGDDHEDLVFGGYDLPGYGATGYGSGTGAFHAGEMWVTKGSDMWKGGSVSASTTWSGNIFINRDVTVESGFTLTIAPGTYVWVWPADAGNAGADLDRIEINVKGTLVANGTTTNPIVFDSWEPQATDDWVGFYFDDQSGGGTFNHCTIKHAEDAIDSYVALAVRNTLIADCRYTGIISHAGTAFIKDCILTDPGEFGIFLTGGNATVRNTTVDNAVVVALQAQPSSTLTARGSQFLNSDKGLFIYGSATVSVDTTCVFNYNNIGIHCYNTGTGPEILRSTIEHNAIKGILCDQGSQPLIQDNTLRYNLVAILCSNSSHPTIHLNMIKSNNFGVKTMTGSDPDVSGGNTFAYTTSKHIVNYNVDIITYAEGNCWNNNTPPCEPPANKFLGDVNWDFPVCCSVSQSSPLSERLPDPDGKPVAVKTGLTAIVPNPFNPTTTVHYGLAAQGTVKIVIYDVAGRFVRELTSGPQAAGRHEALWDGTDARGTPLASGVYFVRMSAGSGTYTMKMVLLK